MTGDTRDTLDTYPDEEWFALRLAVVGAPSHVIQAVVPDLREELRQRDYLRAPRVAWDPQTQWTIVDVEDQGYDPQRTAEDMAEELFEITASVLGDFESFHIDILDVRPHGA